VATNKSPVSKTSENGLAVLSNAAIRIACLVPGLGEFVEGMRVIKSARDELYASKVARFLREFDNLSALEMEQLLTWLASSEDRARFGQTVMLLIDQSDDIEKPALIGRLFRAAALGSIDLIAARRLSAVVNRAFVDDLVLLEHFEQPWNESAHREVAVSLRSLGLLKIIEQDTFDGEANTYVLNTNGEQLLRYGIRGAS
jgi:hypothetical protein